MKIINLDLLAKFRAAWRCEWCGRRTPNGCDPAHVFARGMGGGGQLDVIFNLVSLCRQCHQSHHDGNRPTRLNLLGLVAVREGMFPVEVETEIFRLLQMRK